MSTTVTSNDIQFLSNPLKISRIVLLLLQNKRTITFIPNIFVAFIYFQSLFNKSEKIEGDFKPSHVNIMSKIFEHTLDKQNYLNT